MNATESLIYEHQLISPELQRRVGYSKNKCININNQLHWIHENPETQLIITNMETNNNVIEIPIKSTEKKYKYSFSNYNVILYDDNTLWIGRNSVVNFAKMCSNKNYYKTIPDYNNEVFIIDLINLTYKNITSNYDITHLNAVGRLYFTFERNEELFVFHWNDLLKVNEELIPIHTFHSDVKFYPVNWRESVICKITGKSLDFEFLDKNLNVLFTQNIKDLFKDYKPIKKNLKNKDVFFDEDDKISSIVSINDNCFMYLEYREFVEYDVHILKTGLKHVYCLDLTNNTEILFENGEFEHFIENVIPYRYNGKVKYIAYEWYPAGNWTKNYDSLN